MNGAPQGHRGPGPRPAALARRRGWEARRGQGRPRACGSTQSVRCRDARTPDQTLDADRTLDARPDAGCPTRRRHARPDIRQPRPGPSRHERARSSSTSGPRRLRPRRSAAGPAGTRTAAARRGRLTGRSLVEHPAEAAAAEVLNEAAGDSLVRRADRPIGPCLDQRHRLLLSRNNRLPSPGKLNKMRSGRSGHPVSGLPVHGGLVPVAAHGHRAPAPPSRG